MAQARVHHEDGRRLSLGAVCIDSGGHHTQEVYRFCNMRLGRHIYAIKGMDGAAIKGMDGARPIWPRRAGKSRKLPGTNVWTIGVDTAKDAIYSKLKVTTTGPGYCHFPIAYQQEFFNQLTSEEVRARLVRGHPVGYWFKPSGKRNEALDRRVYALAALHARPVPWEGSPARRTDRTATAAAITARRRSAEPATLIAAYDSG